MNNLVTFFLQLPFQLIITTELYSMYLLLKNNRKEIQAYKQINLKLLLTLFLDFLVLPKTSCTFILCGFS